MSGETVSVLRGNPATDRYNNTVIDWSSPASVDVAGCAVAPRASSEENAGRTAVIVGLSLYAPAGTDILPTDRVVVRGVTYEVDGEPGEWVNPLTGARPGIEVALKRVTG